MSRENKRLKPDDVIDHEITDMLLDKLILFNRPDMFVDPANRTFMSEFELIDLNKSVHVDRRLMDMK